MRLNRKDEMSFQESRHHYKNKALEYTENGGPTRPSTNGFMKAELDPIDHEK